MQNLRRATKEEVVENNHRPCPEWTRNVEEEKEEKRACLNSKQNND